MILAPVRETLTLTLTLSLTWSNPRDFRPSATKSASATALDGATAMKDMQRTGEHEQMYQLTVS